jgi:hypothetical protein
MQTELFRRHRRPHSHQVRRRGPIARGRPGRLGSGRGDWRASRFGVAAASERTAQLTRERRGGLGSVPSSRSTEPRQAATVGAALEGAGASGVYETRHAGVARTAVGPLTAVARCRAAGAKQRARRRTLHRGIADESRTASVVAITARQGAAPVAPVRTHLVAREAARHRTAKEAARVVRCIGGRIAGITRACVARVPGGHALGPFTGEGHVGADHFGIRAVRRCVDAGTAGATRASACGLGRAPVLAFGGAVQVRKVEPASEKPNAEQRGQNNPGEAPSHLSYHAAHAVFQQSMCHSGSLYASGTLCVPRNSR